MFRNPYTNRRRVRRDLAPSTQPVETGLCAIAQMCPLGHASTAEYRRPEFICQSTLLLWIVVGKILPQFSEEIPLVILLALQADAHELRRSRKVIRFPKLTHAVRR